MNSFNLYDGIPLSRVYKGLEGNEEEREQEIEREKAGDSCAERTVKFTNRVILFGQTLKHSRFVFN